MQIDAFTNNRVEATSEASGGAIYNNGTIYGDIASKFEGNSATSTAGKAYGGSIYNKGTITGNITGDIIKSSISAKSDAQGGAIFNSNVIGDITGKITGDTTIKTAKSETGKVSGGAIYNSKTMGSVTGAISNIIVEGTNVDGGVIYNSSSMKGVTGAIADSTISATTGKVTGGILYNKGTMDDVSGDISNTKLTGVNVDGGIIYNDTNKSMGNVTSNVSGTDIDIITKVTGGIILNKGTMGAVSGAISDVTIKGTNVDGGVIYNNSSMGSITNDISNVEVTSTTGKVSGGAIYNSKTMGSVTGAISNIIVEGVNVDGGVIYNSSSMKGVTGAIADSTISATTGKVTGGILYNKGTMDDVSGDISNTKLTGVNVDGGIIYNDTNKSMGNVSSNISGTDIDVTTKVTGGIILNKGTMGSISGAISDVTIKGTNVDGGVVYNSGTIDSLAFDKIENLTIDVTGAINGAYLYNSSATSKIEEISDELEFNNITVNTVNGTIQGLINNNKGTINNTVDDNGDGTSDIIINASNVTFGTKDNIYNANAAVRGGILVNSGNLDVVRGTIQNNTSTAGLKEGYGIGITNGGTIKTIDVDFINNVSNSKSQGPAIYNTGTLGSKDAEGNVLTLGIAEGSQFIGNKIHNYVTETYSMGGAIYNTGYIYGDINNTLFDGNENVSDQGTTQGGAIANATPNETPGMIDNFKNNTFKNNLNESSVKYDKYINSWNETKQKYDVSANARGGVIYNKGTIKSFKNNLFEGNNATSSIGLAQGGAIYNEQNITNGLLNNTYKNNIVESLNEYDDLLAVSGAMGGAINNGSNQWGEKSMEGVIQGGITGLFEANQAKSKASDAMGGAIFNGNIIENGYINATFLSNSAISESGKARGGAISNGMNADIEEYTSGELNSNITSTFIGNYTQTSSGKAQGGAIYNSGTIASIENSNFVNNHAGSTSGTAQGGAIYTSADLLIKANAEISSFDGNYIVNNGIKEENAIYADGINSRINLSLKAINSGSFKLNDNINGNNYNLNLVGDNSGKIYINNTISNADIYHSEIISYLDEGALINHNNSLRINSGTMNIKHIDMDSINLRDFEDDGTINIEKVDIDPENVIMGRIKADNYGETTGIINVNNLNILSNPTKEKVYVAFAHSSFAKNVEYYGIKKYISPIYTYDVGYDKNSGDFYFIAGADPKSKFNSAVLVSPLATLSSIYNAQSINTDYIFEHADYTMRYDICARYMVMKPKGVWVRPYGNHGHMSLSHAPKTTINGQGIFVGYDTDLKHLESNWKTVGTLYLNSNTSREKYDGVSIKQNSLMLGATQTFYKTHFFSAFTGNLNYINNKANNMYGKDKFDIYMAGIANKTGYDIEMLYGDLIVQPSNVISYTYANAEDYTNAANVDIKSKGIHLLQNKPTLTLINNHENAWQLYGSVAYVMNFMDKTDFNAEGVELTKMKLNNYMEYSLGVQRLFEKSEMYLNLTKQHGKDRDNLIGTMGYRHYF